MLTEKLKRFANEWLVDFNATQAAIRAGYSKKTAYSIGYENLRKPELKEYLKKLTEERVLGEEATKKLLSDIATASLNDYFVVKKVVHTPMVEVPLKQVIKDLEATIVFEAEFAKQAKLVDKRMEKHLSEQADRMERLIRLRMEIKQNSKATRIIHGPDELIEVAELDILKVVQDKERARIKSVTYGPNGPKVELHDSAQALTNIARIHGLFEKDNEQTKPDAAIVIFELPQNGR